MQAGRSQDRYQEELYILKGVPRTREEGKFGRVLL